MSPWVEPYSYRLFSRFCGPTPDIIPEYILHHDVEPCLNPPEYWAELEDKNNFVHLLGADYLPRTVAWCQKGHRLSIISNQWSEPTSYILKPSVGTSCGERIVKLGALPTEEFLSNYGDDWVLQETIVQHPHLQRLCSTSVNTLRIAVYRSVCDEQSHITAAVLRVGKEGSVVDNASSGGRYVGVDLTTGHLHHNVYSMHGNPTAQWNGVDYRENMTIPSWEAVQQMALQVSQRVPHQHLLALDIAVRMDGTPVLIEYNMGGFSAYFFHFTGCTVFGEWTEEVLDYCSRK